MSGTVPFDPGFAPPRRLSWNSAIGALVVIGVGILLGLQYVRPNERVIPVLFAVLVFGLAWRIDMVTGIGLVVLLLPYARGTVFGSTNFALLLMLLVIWLLRAAQRQSPGPRRTPLDAPIAGLLLAFVLSFYNLSRPVEIGLAMQTMLMMVAGVLLFYIVVGNVRTERDLERILHFQLFSIVTICLFSLYELSHPGGVLIPGWIDFHATAGAELTRNLRLGGPFRDFELLSEYSAINMLLLLFLLVRARSLLRRVLLAGVLVLNLFVLFATVTRGAMIALFIGVVYLVWVMRRRIQFVPFVIITVVSVVGFMTMNFFVAHYTISGDLFSRLQGTHFVGLVPDDRASAWKGAWERFLIHPIIGWGPVYVAQVGTRLWFWPHNGYLLMANMVGSIGVGFFLWILWKLWTMTRPRAESLSHPSFAQSYLVIANVQLVIFVIDQLKIEFLRNLSYLIQVWLMIGIFVAASRIARESETRLTRTSG